MRPDVEEFFCGISYDAYRLLGSHPAGPGRGWLFTLWAPHARRVQLLGDWNGWDLYSAAELTFCEDGLWRGRVPQAQLGQLYKYNIQGPDGSWQLRADPFAFAFEALPGTASRLAEPNYPFAAPLLRGARRDAPVLIYELHAASWQKVWCPILWSTTTPMWSFCRWQNTRLTAAGATRGAGILPPPSALAGLQALPRWWMPCTPQALPC